MGALGQRKWVTWTAKMGYMVSENGPYDDKLKIRQEKKVNSVC
jgi:hypothetical protein